MHAAPQSSRAYKKNEVYGQCGSLAQIPAGREGIQAGWEARNFTPLRVTPSNEVTDHGLLRRGGACAEKQGGQNFMPVSV